jgi:hypothetical protein
LVVAVSVVTLGRGESPFFNRLRGSRTGRVGSRNEKLGIEVEIEPSPHSRSTEKTLLKRVVVPHRGLMFWPHWCTTKGVA